MPKRLLANLIAVTLIVGAFFGVTSIINLMAATDEVTEQEFSFLKRTGDHHWGEKNWAEAARYYKELAEKDDLNVGAHLAYAWNLSQQVSSDLRKRDPNSQGKIVLSAETEAVVKQAIEAYEETLSSTQFRNISRVQLGWLHGLLGEIEVAVPYLVSALEDGYLYRNLRTQFVNQDVLSDPRVKAAIDAAHK